MNMKETAFHNIHDQYITLGIELTQDCENLTKDVALLHQRFVDLQKEYIAKVLSLGDNKTLTVEEAKNRNLLSTTDLQQKLFRDIAAKLHLEANTITNAKQLLNALIAREHSEPRIPLPDIHGTIENIGMIILPPDIREILVGTGAGRDKKEHPVGFDKVGLVEEWLSKTLGRARRTFHRKEGILRDNQMRKVSYYHIYIPEANKTLLLNNQYGEGIFLVEGDFSLREAKKSDLKGSSEAVMIRFDYSDPEKFLKELEVKFRFPIQKENMSMTAEVKKELDALWWYEVLMKYAQKQLQNIKIKNFKISAIGTQSWFKSQFGRSMQSLRWFQEFVCWMYNKPYEQLSKSSVKQEFDKLWWYEELMKYSAKQLRVIKIKKSGINTIVTETWFKSKFWLTVDLPGWFQEFISRLYDKPFSYESATLPSNEEILQGFDDLWWYDTLMKYSFEQLRTIKIKKAGVSLIATQTWFKSKYWLDARTASWFQEFISWFYNKPFSYEQPISLSKKEIQQGFDDLWWYDTLMKYTQRQITPIKIRNFGVFTIASQAWFKSKFWLYIMNLGWFQEFISWLYDKPFSYEQSISLSKKEIQQEFDDLWWYDILMKYTQKQIDDLKVKNLGLKALATQAWFEPTSLSDVRTKKWFKEFISWFYDKPLTPSHKNPKPDSEG